MTNFIAQSLMNSILTAARTCDDTLAILERMNATEGIQVVSDGDLRAVDMAVSFIYPNGARKAYDEFKSAQSSVTQTQHQPHCLQVGGGMNDDECICIKSSTDSQEVNENSFEASEIIYPAHIVLGGNGSFIISFRDIPEALTQGDDWKDAMEMAVDALSTAIDFYEENKRPVPRPSTFQHGEVAIAMSKEDALRVNLHNLSIGDE